MIPRVGGDSLIQMNRLERVSSELNSQQPGDLMLTTNIEF